MSEAADDMSEEMAAAVVVATGLRAALAASRSRLELTDGPADWQDLLQVRLRR
jgi:hypothetical protein